MSDPVRAPSESAPPEKPALLKGGMVMCWIYAAVLVLLLWDPPALATMGEPGIAGGRSIPGLPPARVVSAQTLEAMRIFAVPVLVLSIITAYGLAKDRRWSRWVMMLLLLLGIVMVPPQLATPVDYAISAGLALFGWWYLYRKPDVVGYYDAIKASETNR